uniref:hypothetical protein n=1 Tax=Candidatus Albibeggiatoa sp. nov. BB20 TaxID=3162723 RepID=UPI0033656A7E
TIDTSVRFEKVYNLTVANTHNYFVGDDGMLVHNCLTKAQQAAVKKINEIEHMLRTHNNLSGDLLDDGHINKLKDSRVGIGKSIRSIMNSLRNPNLNSEARAILEQQLRIAQRIWDRIDEILSSL